MKSHEEQEQELKTKLSGLVADLVHQMNTPLTNIRMYCDFLLMPDLDEGEPEAFLANISRQAEKLGWFGEGFEKGGPSGDGHHYGSADKTAASAGYSGSDQPGGHPGRNRGVKRVLLEGDRGYPRSCGWKMDAGGCF